MCVKVSVVFVSVSVSVPGVVWCGVLVIVDVVLLVSYCLVNCRRRVACCTLTFTPDVETSFGDLQEVMVTPAICPRLFETLHHVDFRSSA